MNIKIMVLEKHRDAGLKAREEEYIKRIGKYCKVSCEVLKRPKIHDAARPDEVCLAEAEMIEKRLKASDYVVVLDSRGKMITSEQFADTVKSWQQEGVQSLVFIIGGPYGVADTIKKRAHYQLSLSRMTFGHEVARLLICEALYRSFDMLNGGNYHK